MAFRPSGRGRPRHYGQGRIRAGQHAFRRSGTYSLYTIPRPEGWTLVVNRQTGESGREDAYDAARDVARIPLQIRSLDTPVETLTIRLDPEGDGAVLRVAWERTEAWVPITVR